MWEYMQIYHHQPLNILDRRNDKGERIYEGPELAELGKEGWELVAICARPINKPVSHPMLYVFKRELKP